MKRGDLILFVFSGILMLSSFSVLGREPLTFEQRVKAQEAIEKIYYNHRIWPKENKSPKPAFEKMVSKETIEAKVTDYLKKSAALEKYWYRPITGEQLQAEMDRMAKGTKDPATLNELFEALNNDPYLIAECLARPVLADRLVRNWYANDERFHEETRKKAEEALKHLTSENFCSYPEGQYSKMTYRLEIEGREEMDMPDLEDRAIKLSEKEFAKMFQEIPEEGKISGVIEKNDCFVILHTALKNEVEMIVEGVTFKKVSSAEIPYPDKIQDDLIADRDKSMKSLGIKITNIYLMPEIYEVSCGGKWENGSLDNMPDGRAFHVSVWTGTEMIIWGGFGGTGCFNDGGRYNPSTDTWIGLPTFNAPPAVWDSCAVWTGTEMVVWGGFDNHGDYNYSAQGGCYNPVDNSWRSTSTIGAPLARRLHTAVWYGGASNMRLERGAGRRGYCAACQ